MLKNLELGKRKKKHAKPFLLTLSLLALTACGSKAPQTDTYQEELLEELRKAEAEAEALEAQILEEEANIKALEEELAQMINPWTEASSMAEAEEKTGLTLPEEISGYKAQQIRVMNDTLLEILYVNDDTEEVLVRKQEGEGEDISGDYNVYDVTEEKETEDGKGTVISKRNDTSSLTLIFYGGYSFSMYTEDGYWGDVWADFYHAFTNWSDHAIEDNADTGAAQPVQSAPSAQSAPPKAQTTPDTPDETTGATPRNPDDEPDRTAAEMIQAQLEAQAALLQAEPTEGE